MEEAKKTYTKKFLTIGLLIITVFFLLFIGIIILFHFNSNTVDLKKSRITINDIVEGRFYIKLFNGSWIDGWYYLSIN